jgi:hypothetical protein
VHPAPVEDGEEVRPAASRPDALEILRFEVLADGLEGSGVIVLSILSCAGRLGGEMRGLPQVGSSSAAIRSSPRR